MLQEEFNQFLKQQMDFLQLVQTQNFQLQSSVKANELLQDTLKQRELTIAQLQEATVSLNTLVNKLQEPKPDWEVKADKMIAWSEYAEKLRIPYKFGAEWINDKAFDCSSFVLNLYLHIGIKIPRGAGDQSKTGKEVKVGEFRKGDLLFFDVNGGTPNAGHVGMYIGDNTMRHTNNPELGIHTNTLEPDSYWMKRFVTARRILE